MVNNWHHFSVTEEKVFYKWQITDLTVKCLIVRYCECGGNVNNKDVSLWGKQLGKNSLWKPPVFSALPSGCRNTGFLPVERSFPSTFPPLDTEDKNATWAGWSFSLFSHEENIYRLDVSQFWADWETFCRLMTSDPDSNLLAVRRQR